VQARYLILIKRFVCNYRLPRENSIVTLDAYEQRGRLGRIEILTAGRIVSVWPWVDEFSLRYFAVGLATPTSTEGGAERRLRNSNLADGGGTI